MRNTVICFWLAASVSLSASEPPAELLDLSHWRLTLPVDTPRQGKPDEVRQPDLLSFVDPRYFFINEDGDGVVFRAHCGGHPTKGSDYPRCELRELNAARSDRAAWDTAADVIHTMTMKAAINATPAVKKHVVCAQIHHADDDLLMIRLEGTKLFIERNSANDVMMTRKYKLGTLFRLKIQAGHGKVRVWLDDELQMDWKVSQAGCYFKAGCYTQSNPSKGDRDESFGEVEIYRLRVEHRTEP